MDAETLKKIIAEGENVEVELKQSFHSVQDVAKDICAFANTQGGLLILGVKDNGAIEGEFGQILKKLELPLPREIKIEKERDSLTTVLNLLRGY